MGTVSSCPRSRTVAIARSMFVCMVFVSEGVGGDREEILCDGERARGLSKSWADGREKTKRRASDLKQVGIYTEAETKTMAAAQT